MIELTKLVEQFHVPECGLIENYLLLKPKFNKEQSLNLIRILLEAGFKDLSKAVECFIKNIG